MSWRDFAGECDSREEGEVNDNLQQQAATLFANFYEQAETEVGFTELVQILGGGTPKTGEKSYWNGKLLFFTPKDIGFPYTLSTEKTITEAKILPCAIHQIHRHLDKQLCVHQ